jgi:hypothetical protein
MAEDFIIQAAKQLEEESSGEALPPPVDGEQLLRRAVEDVSLVNRSQPIPVTVTDYAILVLADAIARRGRRVF